jgi:hypothetical protein
LTSKVIIDTLLDRIKTRAFIKSTLIPNPAFRSDRRNMIREAEKLLNDIIRDLEADNSPYGEGDRVTLVSLLRQITTMLGSNVKNMPTVIEPAVVMDAVSVAKKLETTVNISTNVVKLCKLGYNILMWIFGNGPPAGFDI